MHVDWLVALVTFLLVVVAVASIWATWRLGRRQEILQQQLADKRFPLSAAASAIDNSGSGRWCSVGTTKRQ